MENLITAIEIFQLPLIAGIVISAACGLFGVFMVLDGSTFLGITLSEAAATGIAISMLTGINPFIGAFAATILTVGLISQPLYEDRIPSEAKVGVAFIFFSSLAVLLVSKSGFGLHEVKALLYGDLILVSKAELNIISLCLIPSSIFLIVFIRPFKHTFMDREASQILGVKPRSYELIYYLLLGLVISASSKAAGAILTFSYLAAGAATALVLSGSLPIVLLISVMASLISTFTGIGISYIYDLPTNQTICVVQCLFFILACMKIGKQIP
jgi:manganese/iron transport system permease protein/iron/zinc/copper transport system permease protein